MHLVVQVALDILIILKLYKRMKKVINTLLIVFAALIISSFKTGEERYSFKLGTFELMRLVNPNEFIEYYGEPTKKFEPDIEIYGELVKGQGYIYTDKINGSMQIRFVENRVNTMTLKKRDPKLALNGKLMVGDHKSKVKKVFNDFKDMKQYGYNRINSVIKGFKYKNPLGLDREVSYTVRIGYDDNDIITHISIHEFVGV